MNEHHACCAHRRSALGLARGTGFASTTASAHYAPDVRVLPEHLDIHVAVDVDARALEVTLGVRVRARVAQATQLVLHGVDLVGVQAEGASLRYTGTELTLGFEPPLARDEARELTLRYRVESPKSGVLFSSPEPHRPDAPRYAVTDHETERARHWLACIDLPAVRTTLAWHLRTPASFTALANGALVGEDVHEGGEKTTHYRLDTPCPSYLACFAVGEFVRADGEPVGDIPVASFAAAPFDAETLTRTFGRTSEMLTWMQGVLGPYPFPKYFQFAAEGIGGAMENISLVSWDDRFLLDEALAAEETLLADIINVHEMAHSWFGDDVVCHDHSHAWLKESWATYMETCWWEHRYGREALEYDLYRCQKAYFSEVRDRYARPIVTRTYDSSFDLFDMHLYPGGGFRLHMLRRLLGDDVFFPAVRSYLARFRGKTVETDDFRRVLEEHSGRSLGRFFDQWLRSPGYPKLEVAVQHDDATRETRITITQTQRDEAKGIPLFAFDLPLEITTKDRTFTVTVAVSDARHVVLLPLDAPAERVRVDPTCSALFELVWDPGAPALRAQLTQTDDVRGRILAAHALVKTGHPRDTRAVVDAFEPEPFWGVRCEWAEALGDAQTETALGGLLALAETHQNPLSLACLLRQLGRYRDARVVACLKRRLDAGLPPRAHEAALEALGAQRENAPRDLLEAHASLRQHGGFAPRGALRGLGKTHQPEARDVLRDALRPGGLHDLVRVAAADGLGELCPHLSDAAQGPAKDALEDALRDPHPRVRKAAAGALVAASASERAGSIEAYAATLAHQDRVTVQRMLGGLSKSGPDANAKALDALRDKLRALEERLVALEARRSDGDAGGPGGGAP
ncbi:MAG: HEAT repeat domain-containing protein [Sandaracinaceae bacterium]|nr:HEAT repeat domain-containing protein [Sandaracinaceae bacterium]